MVLCIHINEKDKIHIGEFSSQKFQIKEGDIIYFYIDKEKKEVTLSIRKPVFPEVCFSAACTGRGKGYFLKNPDLVNSLLHFFKLYGNGSSKIIFQVNQLSNQLYKMNYLSCV
jgi:hypothetical protein